VNVFDVVSRFVEQHVALFNVLHAASSAMSFIGWLVAIPVLMSAVARGRVESVKMGGLQMNFAQRQVEVAFSRATRQRAAKDRKPGERSQPTAELAKLNAIIERAFSPEDQANLVGKGILWVDDNPKNNENEAMALRRIGLDVDQVLSTEAGLEALRERPYDMVISDMGRGAENFAGYQLLDAIRSRSNPVPFIIYSAEGSKSEHRTAARQRGALGSTDYPHELLEMIVATLGEALPVD
jgi:CheY-like chemotaxis protein